MFGLVLLLVLFYVAAYICDSNIARQNRGKLFVTALLVSIAQNVVSRVSTNIWVAYSVAILVPSAVAFVLVRYWCKYSDRAALKITIIYMSCSIVFALGLRAVIAAMRN